MDLLEYNKTIELSDCVVVEGVRVKEVHDGVVAGINCTLIKVDDYSALHPEKRYSFLSDVPILLPWKSDRSGGFSTGDFVTFYIKNVKIPMLSCDNEFKGSLYFIYNGFRTDSKGRPDYKSMLRKGGDGLTLFGTFYPSKLAAHYDFTYKYDNKDTIGYGRFCERTRQDMSSYNEYTIGLYKDRRSNKHRNISGVKQ